jgi:hypothetical protein
MDCHVIFVGFSVAMNTVYWVIAQEEQCIDARTAELLYALLVLSPKKVLRLLGPQRKLF